jgi:hypothetical protein
MNHSRNGPLAGTFDWKKFGLALSAEVARRGASIRDIAKDIRVGSHTALYERMQGKPCGVELMMFLCAEFGLSPWAYFKSKHHTRKRVA